jgi:hypothetical protein
LDLITGYAFFVSQYLVWKKSGGFFKTNVSKNRGFKAPSNIFDFLP